MGDPSGQQQSGATPIPTAPDDGNGPGGAGGANGPHRAGGAADLVLAAKRPVSALAGPYRHPFHPILVTVPIGAWVTSLVFDVASRIVADPGFLAKGSLWLIAVGVLGALLAAAVGFLDLLGIPPGSAPQRVALLHMAINLAVTTAYAVGFLWRRGTYAHPGAVGAGMIVLSAVSLAALACSGYLGGKLAYRYGVRVADEATQAAAYTRAAPGSH